ncbi:MAG: DUF2309 domain-containing protein [Chryseolinea sp.]
MIETNLIEANVSVKSVTNDETLLDILRKASKKIAPVWPLENFVAVNPYLGLTHKKFENAALDLAYAGGIQMTLPTSFYLKKMKAGELKHEHIAAALEKKKQFVDVDEFLTTLKSMDHEEQEQCRVLTFADVASRVTNRDWSRFSTARISNWAASYFDSGQAIWNTSNQEQGIFAAWKEDAKVDLTPEVTGLKNFRKAIQALPDDPLEAAQVALLKLGIPKDGIDIYLHSLLIHFGGWSAYAARLDWDSELYGGTDGNLIEFLALLLCWEACLLDCIGLSKVERDWKEACKILSNATVQKESNQQLTQKLILQEAFELATQRIIINKFQGVRAASVQTNSEKKAQAIFCIDVRSEVFRRNLELVDNSIETLGFAGFFAFPIKYVPIGNDGGEAQCPVLLKTGPTILEEMPDKNTHQLVLNKRLLYRQVHQVWKSFKSGAVTCFSFVSPIGLSYLPKLITDSFSITRPVPHPDQVGIKSKYIKMKRASLNTANHDHEDVGIALEHQIQMGKNALKAMSLSDDLAKYVLIVGHGSSMVNNPHATGYDCGACGGHTGEANARVAAAVLNSAAVRAGLQKENIFIPTNTVFLACLHDTTTDEITIFNEYNIPSDQLEELENLKESLKRAGQGARTERLIRLTTSVKSNADKSILMRSKDWSQTRPEWGLAGCAAFIVAPRARTQGIDFEGRAFLHSYDWKKDRDFSVLELIMTAPMVVTSWISLQYYGSTVDNRIYGSGNKTLHNVTAGIGVLEGFSGDLRVGLPWQAVHDGEKYQHEPVKLNVIIEAPIEAMNAVLEKHKPVRDLCDNGWLHLLAMDGEGKVSHRYEGDLNWQKMDSASHEFF